MRLDDVVAQIRGEKGTVVRLNVIPVNSKSESSAHIVSITRDEVQLEDKKATKEIITLNHQGAEFTIGVIDLPTFYFNFEAANQGVKDYNSSTRDVRELIIELKEESVDGIVIDLRDNGGGSLSEVNQLVGLFIDTGATVQIRYSGLRNGFVRSYGDADPEVTYDGPLAVLVNRASASASEIFAGAIQDYERGIVLGGQTFGKGTVQEIIPMDYGQVKLTRSKFYRISGASTQNRGVLPDIHFPDIYTAYEEMGESSLDGALPWDTVRATEYRSYLPIQKVLPEVKNRHEARVSENPDFIYLSNQVKRRKELQAKTELSLVEGVVREEREVSRRIEFDADNMRRLLKGQPLNIWESPLQAWDFGEDKLVDVEIDIQDADAEVDSAEPEEIASSDDEVAEEVDPVDTEVAEIESEADPLLVESGHILLDMTELMKNQLASNSK